MKASISSMLSEETSNFSILYSENLYCSIVYDFVSIFHEEDMREEYTKS